MVLISIDPFTYRRILLIVAALLGLSAVCFADPVLMAQRYSPNHRELDLSKTIAPAGRQPEKAEKVPMVGPQLGGLEFSDLVRNETEWRPTQLLANLGLAPAESSSGFSNVASIAMSGWFVSGMVATRILAIDT